MARAHRLGGRESSQTHGGSSRCTCGGWQPPMAPAHKLSGPGVQSSRWSRHMERLWGMAAPNGTGPQARGTGSSAQPVVAAEGAPKGDGSPQRRGPTRWGDGEFSEAGGRSSRCT